MTDASEFDPRVAQKKELANLQRSVHKRTLSQWFASLAKAERINNGLPERIRLSMEPKQ